MTNEIEDDVTPADEPVELVVINPETNLPYWDKDDPILIPGSDFRILKEEATAKGMTFEEYLRYILKLVIENSASANDFSKADFELDKFEDLK
jgi:hypothetical protein